MKKLTKLIGLLGLLVMVSCGKNASINTAKVEDCLNGGTECETLAPTPVIKSLSDFDGLTALTDENQTEFERYDHEGANEVVFSAGGWWNKQWIKITLVNGEYQIEYLVAVRTQLINGPIVVTHPTHNTTVATLNLEEGTLTAEGLFNENVSAVLELSL